MTSYIYLASPYSHLNSLIRQARYELVLDAAARLTKAGKVVFSPIVYCHPMAKEHGLPGDFNFWKNYNETMIKPAEELHVLCMDGLANSKGVAGEYSMALEFGVPTKFINSDTLNFITIGDACSIWGFGNANPDILA